MTKVLNVTPVVDQKRSLLVLRVVLLFVVLFVVPKREKSNEKNGNGWGMIGIIKDTVTWRVGSE